MIDLATVGQIVKVVAETVSVVAACWAIVTGVNAWKKEFIGKRQIELADKLLETLHRVKDAIALIRDANMRAGEGQNRQRRPSETPKETEILDRAYAVAERAKNNQDALVAFCSLKYRCMATFGADTKKIFEDTEKIYISIVNSAHQLAKFGALDAPEDLPKVREWVESQERVLWGRDSETKKQLEAIEIELDIVTAECFKRPVKWYSKLMRRRSHG